MNNRRKILILLIVLSGITIAWFGSRQQRMMYRQEALKKEIYGLKNASEYILMKEDSVDSLLYQTDSFYRVKIIKEAQRRIYNSDTLLLEAWLKEKEYDSLEQELQE